LEWLYTHGCKYHDVVDNSEVLGISLLLFWVCVCYALADLRLAIYGSFVLPKKMVAYRNELKWGCQRIGKRQPSLII